MECGEYVIEQDIQCITSVNAILHSDISFWLDGPYNLLGEL